MPPCSCSTCQALRATRHATEPQPNHRSDAINVGTRVRIKPITPNIAQRFHNLVGTVSLDDGTDFVPYHVDTPAGKVWVGAYQVDIISDAIPVGTRIKVIAQDPAHGIRTQVGQVGSVIEHKDGWQPGRWPRYRIRLENGTSWNINDEQLEVLPAEAPKPARLAVGTQVKMPDRDIIGTITEDDGGTFLPYKVEWTTASGMRDWTWYGAEGLEIVTEAPITRLAVGTKVRILTSDVGLDQYVGKIGTVEQDDKSALDKLPYHVCTDVGTAWFNHDWLEVVTEAPARLAVGTKVRVISERDCDTDRKGDVGTIVVDDGCNEENGLPYCIDFNDRGGNTWFNRPDLEVVTEEPKTPERFAVGTKVKVVRGVERIGEVGTIALDDHEDWRPYWVKFTDTSPMQCYNPDELELVVDAPPAQPQPAVGNQVRIISTKPSDRSWTGKIGTISEVRSNHNVWPYKVQFGSDPIKSSVFAREDFELLTDTPVTLDLSENGLMSVNLNTLTKQQLAFVATELQILGIAAIEQQKTAIQELQEALEAGSRVYAKLNNSRAINERVEALSIRQSEVLDAYKSK